MVTTAVVAEIVVGGLGAAVWISLLVLAIFGSDWVDPSALADWTTLVTLLVVALAYVLGVLIDRIADNFLLRINKRWPPPEPVAIPAEGVGHMRMTLLAASEPTAKFFDYQRSRMRVARATALNLALTVPALVAFLWRSDVEAAVVVAAAGATLLATALATYVARKIEYAYVGRLSEAYRVHQGLSPGAGPP